jgi:hypothetical protein
MQKRGFPLLRSTLSALQGIAEPGLQPGINDEWPRPPIWLEDLPKIRARTAAASDLCRI